MLRKRVSVNVAKKGLVTEAASGSKPKNIVFVGMFLIFFYCNTYFFHRLLFFMDLFYCNFFLVMYFLPLFLKTLTSFLRKYPTFGSNSIKKLRPFLNAEAAREAIETSKLASR